MRSTMICRPVSVAVMASVYVLGFAAALLPGGAEASIALTLMGVRIEVTQGFDCPITLFGNDSGGQPFVLTAISGFSPNPYNGSYGPGSTISPFFGLGDTLNYSLSIGGIDVPIIGASGTSWGMGYMDGPSILVSSSLASQTITLPVSFNVYFGLVTSNIYGAEPVYVLSAIGSEPRSSSCRNGVR